MLCDTPKMLHAVCIPLYAFSPNGLIEIRNLPVCNRELSAETSLLSTTSLPRLSQIAHIKIFIEIEPPLRPCTSS